MIDINSFPLDHDEHWMRLALDQARQAFELGEVPVGAIVVQDSQVIAAGGNQRESLQDPTASAEMIAITQAAAPCNRVQPNFRA